MYLHLLKKNNSSTSYKNSKISKNRIKRHKSEPKDQMRIDDSEVDQPLSKILESLSNSASFNQMSYIPSPPIVISQTTSYNWPFFDVYE